jgi:N-acetylglucosaminyl-diphospho-decaprenol L-rhamnosyltransferase
MLTISIVSHGHGALVADLLRDLDAVVKVPFQVLLTHNIPEPDPADAAALRYPLTIIRNPRPRGFGANHNAACRVADGEFFCVINPDVRLSADPFPHLLGTLADPAAGVVAPVIMDAAGNVESTARRFPTPLSILRKAVFGAPALEYALQPLPLQVDWVSGVFLVLRREVYQRFGGFDERYFLYYEDVDLCARLHAQGYSVRQITAVSAVHAARRDSHRRPRYMAWHLRSMLRFFLTRY